MSRFYTYAELKERPPTKEAVTRARELVTRIILENSFSRHAVIYGSTVWGTNKKFGDRHTRRSDIDVAFIEREGDNYPYNPHISIYKIKDILLNAALEVGVPIEVVHIGTEGPYGGFIWPSTLDHFRLLEREFPEAPYKDFLKSMSSSPTGREEDFRLYVEEMRQKVFDEVAEEVYYNYKRLNLQNPKTLESLCKLENFPDHIARKLLGKEQMLPCPDSKEDIRRAFVNFPYRWKIRDILLQHFGEIFSLSDEYEALIDEVLSKILSETDYYNRLRKIAEKIFRRSAFILSNFPSNILEAQREEIQQDT